MILPAGLLSIGVVYTQMHYAVDVFAGLLVAGGIGAMAVASSGDACDTTSARRRLWRRALVVYGTAAVSLWIPA